MIASRENRPLCEALLWHFVRLLFFCLVEKVIFQMIQTIFSGLGWRILGGSEAEAGGQGRWNCHQVQLHYITLQVQLHQFILVLILQHRSLIIKYVGEIETRLIISIWLSSSVPDPHRLHSNHFQPQECSWCWSTLATGATDSVKTWRKTWPLNLPFAKTNYLCLKHRK